MVRGKGGHLYDEDDLDYDEGDDWEDWEEDETIAPPPKVRLVSSIEFDLQGSHVRLA